jgi:hypothetical protein
MTEPPSSPIQAATRIAESAIDGLRTTPTLLVMVILNCVMIGAAAWYLLKLEENRQRERERFTTILERCMRDGAKP